MPLGPSRGWDKKTGQAIEPELPVSIGIIEDPAQGCSGPLWIRGGIQIESADGFEYEVRIGSPCAGVGSRRTSRSVMGRMRR